MELPLQRPRRTTASSPLTALPIAFDEQAHSYRWLPSGEMMAHSVTGILSARKTAEQLAIFERTKHLEASRHQGSQSH